MELISKDYNYYVIKLQGKFKNEEDSFVIVWHTWVKNGLVSYLEEIPPNDKDKAILEELLTNKVEDPPENWKKYKFTETEELRHGK